MRALKRTLAVTATLIAGTATLTACTEEQAYCVDLAGYAASAVNVDPQNPADYTKILEDAKKLQGSAPAEVKDDWGIVVAFAEKAKDAKGDTGKLTELAKSDGEKIAPAFEAITKQAKDTCKVDIEG